jgi:hypothetical protein
MSYSDTLAAATSALSEAAARANRASGQNPDMEALLDQLATDYHGDVAALLQDARRGKVPPPSAPPPPPSAPSLFHAPAALSMDRKGPPLRVDPEPPAREAPRNAAAAPAVRSQFLGVESRGRNRVITGPSFGSEFGASAGRLAGGMLGIVVALAVIAVMVAVGFFVATSHGVQVHP